MRSSSSTTTPQNNRRIPLRFLPNLPQPTPCPRVTLHPKIPAPRRATPATIYQTPHHYYTQLRWLPSPFSSEQKKGNARIHVHRASLAFLFHGTAKNTQWLGSTRYLEYLFNRNLLLIYPYNNYADPLLGAHALWTLPCRYVIALHSFSSGFSSLFAVFVFSGYLYRALAYVELVVVELYQLGSYDTFIQYLTWNLRELEGE